MVFSFGHDLVILVWSFHLGMVFSFGYSLFTWVWSFHLGMVFSFGYFFTFPSHLAIVLSMVLYGFKIWVLSFHYAYMVFPFRYDFLIILACSLIFHNAFQVLYSVWIL